jgi:hypothetical protein
VVIHHADRLHMCVHDGAAHECKTSLLQVEAQFIGNFRGLGNLPDIFPVIYDRFAVDKSPDIMVEGAEFVPDFQEFQCIVDCRMNF